MKFLVIACLTVFCLAHVESVRKGGITMIHLASTDRDNESLKADFIGGGVIQDSCRGAVKFSSKLNHNGISNSGFSSKLDNIRYEVVATP